MNIFVQLQFLSIPGKFRRFPAKNLQFSFKDVEVLAFILYPKQDKFRKLLKQFNLIFQENYKPHSVLHGL
jgi:hypothetical protein